MADNSEIDNIDKTPLLKPKRTRPPPSEKQKENFKILQQKRAESIAKRKQEKILEAQKALLQKEGLIGESAKSPEPQPLRFEIEEEEEEVKPIQKALPKKKQVKEKVQAQPVPAPPQSTPIKPTVKKSSIRRQPPIIEESSESEDSTDSEDEVIVIKRKKKKSIKPRKQPVLSDDDESYESVANPSNYTNQPNVHNMYGGFFC